MSKEKINKITYAPNSPLIAETRKSPLKEIKHNNYGVRKIKQRIQDKPKFTLNTRH
jgi:hypothetical protein|tara:strand:- start:2313 stop:2480 length:168 start_codon:yes stop_codon:yes gene_type:complete